MTENRAMNRVAFEREIPWYVQRAKYAWAFVIALYFVASSANSLSSIAMVPIVIWFLPLRQSNKKSWGLDDRRTLALMVLNAFFAFFVFAFFPRDPWVPPVHWIVLAVAIHCIAMVAYVGRYQAKLESAQS